jgi:glycosyltransferase involved in cell wall biosynthesis
VRVLYDGFLYGFLVTGGISRYFADLVGNLPADVQPVLSTPRWPTVPELRHPRLEVHARMVRPSGIRARRLRRWFEARHFRRLARRLACDVLHPTYYELLSREPLGAIRRPVVLTVHDMIHELFPGITDPRGRWAETKRRAILAADALICVSENTRTDLLNLLPVDESRVVVIPEATQLAPPDAAPSAGADGRPQFLHVGGRAGYKNFDLLLRAIRGVVVRFPEARLAVAGAPFDAAEHDRIASLGLGRHVRHHGLVDDAELARLYRDSVALVYPSLYEGFGIPPLEGMRCGTAVVAANTSSIPEVVGDAGILVDPRSEEELAAALCGLLDDPARRAALVERGCLRERRFRWDEIAARTVAVYRSVVAAGGAAHAA